MERIKLKLGDIANPAFVQAFTRLGEEDIPAKEKYALGRSLRQIQTARETFEEQRINLIKKYGKPNEQIINAKLAKLKESPRVEILGNQIKQLEGQLAFLEASGQKMFSIDDTDTEKMDAFQKEMKEMSENTCEIYLDHLIILPATVKLSSNDLSLLLDICQPALEAPAK